MTALLRISLGMLVPVVPADAIAPEEKVKSVAEVAGAAVPIRKRSEVRDRWVTQRLPLWHDGHKGKVERVNVKMNETPER